MSKIVTVTYTIEVEAMDDNYIENNIYQNVFLGIARGDISDLTIEGEEE